MAIITYRYETEEKRTEAIKILDNYKKGMNFHEIELYLPDEPTDGKGHFLLHIGIFEDGETYDGTYALEDVVSKDKKDNDTFKKILKYTAIGLIGVIIGRKTSRYKKFKKTFTIETKPDWTNEMCYAANDIMDQLNNRMKENHLVLVVDKKYRRN